MPTNLDSLIPDAPKQGGDLSDLIPDHNDVQRSGLQGSMFVAGQTDPDKMADAVNLATKYNVDPMFAHENLPELKKADAAKNTDYENLIQNYPGTTNFLQKPENAAISHDDLESLNQIDHATQIVSKKNGFIDDLGTSIHSGFNDLQRAVISLGVAHGLLDKDNAAANLESLSRDSARLDALKPDYLKDFQTAMSENKKDLGASLNQIDQGYQEAKNNSLTAAMKDFAGGSVSTIGSLLDFAKTMAVSPRASLYTGLESSVPILPMIAGGAIGGAALGTIGTIAGSFMGGAPIFIGQKFDQKMQEKGLDPKNPEDLRTAYSDPKLMSEFRDQADKYGLTFGALTSLFSGLGGIFAKEGVSIAEPGVASALKSGAETAGRFAAGAGLQSAGLATGQAAGEVAAGEKPDIAGALQNAVLMLGQGAAIEALSLGKKAIVPRETVEGQIVNPPGETPESPIHDIKPEQKLLTTSKREAYSPNPTEAIQQVAQDTQSAVHALQGLQALDEMGGAVKGSKLAERVPDKIEELVKASGGDGNVFFQSNDWDQYWTKKGLSPAKAAEQIMGDASAYLEAKETGQDLAVPLAKYVSKIAPTEHYEPLLNFVKTEPNGMKFEDAKAHMESVPETVSKISQEAGQTKDEAKSLADRAYDQLVAAGRSPEEAKAASQIIESRLNTRSAITGISPQEHFNQYGFDITHEKGETLGEQPKNILNQSPIENAPAFYSKLQKTIDEKMGNSATVEQVRALTRELKPEEVQYSGINDFLKGKSKVSKEDLLNHLRENQIQIKEVVKNREGSGITSTYEDATKFSKYTLPGGENYREVLLTLPDKNKPETPLEDVLKSPPLYRSSHFDEPNILAHMRLDDRVDSEGKKVLFIEEVQSDWHQEGRKKGYKGDVKALDTLPEGYTVEPTAGSESQWYVRKPNGEIIASGFNKEGATNAGINELNRKADSTVPDAPFKKTWQELALKRIIREAAEKGYDKVAWTTGEQQAERYDLSKQVKDISYVKKSDGRYSLYVTGKDGESIVGGDKYSESELEGVVGKEMAQKIANGEGHQKKMSTFSVEKEGKDSFWVVNQNGNKYAEFDTRKSANLHAKILEKNEPLSTLREFSGLDLKVGGEGMKGFYDKILVDAANKLVKKFGAKVEESSLANPEAQDTYTVVKKGSQFKLINDRTNQARDVSFSTRASADEMAEHLNTDPHVSDTLGKVHSLELTPALKASVLKEGFSLFQGPNDEGPRGQIEFGPYKALITLGEKADASTFIHESFHLWTKEFQDDFNHLKNQSSLNARQKQFMADAQSLLSYVGADSFESMKAEQWEKIAESGEEYLREGKAPTAELQGAFARFKTWISYLYRAFKNNGIKLSDDIRGVFDRMLASQDESSKEVVNPLFKEPATAGMSEAQAQKYVQLQSELRQHSEDQLRSALLKDLERRQSKDYKAERAKIKEHVTDTINNDPVYRALSVLRDGTLPDGSELPPGTFPMKLSKESVLEEYSKEYVEGLPSGIFDKDTGLPADMVAESFGFHSGDDLLHSLLNLPTKKSAIEELTNQGMKELFPDLVEQPQLSDEAVKAAHNDKKSEMLRMELEHLASDKLPQFKEQIRNISRRVPTDLEVRNKAQAILSKIPISQISSYTYELAERKAAKEAGENLAKGDLEGAYQAKNRELLNHELYKAAALAKETVQKAEETFRKVAQKDEDIAKNRDTDLVNAARALLSQYGLGRTKKTPLEYLEKIRAYDPEKFATLSDMIGPVGPNRDYRSLPLEDFMNLKYSFDALWSLAKSENQVLVDGKMMDKAIAAEAVKSDLSKFESKKRPEKYNRSITSFEKQKMDLESALASGRITESLIDQWSEGNIDSNLRKILFDPVNQGAENYHEASLKVQSELKNILDPISKTLKLKKIEAPEIGYTFGTKADLLGALIHTGNDSNLSKLLRGRGWGEYDEGGNLNRSRWDAFVSRMQREGVLTKTDYDFAQNIWNLFEKLKPEAQAAHKSMYGHYFEEITRKPFKTPYGEYSGGYIPAKVDPYENRAAEIREEKAAFEKIENSWAFPTTGRGFTKSRIDAYAAPLDLSLTHLPGALDFELRFIHIEPRVKETAKLLWDKEVRDSLNGVHPYAVKDILVPWLQRTASQQITFPGSNRFLDRAFRYLKSSTQMQYLMFNVGSAAKRISGVGTALVKVPAEHLLPAFFDYATSPRKTTKSIQERSAFMRVHTSEQLAEVKEAIQKIELNPNPLVRAHEIAKPYTSLLIKSVQHILDNTTWLGAYNQEMAKMPVGLTSEEMQERASRKADSAVRLTQGSSFPEHVSRWATGTTGQQMLKMFVNHFNTIGNLQVSEQAQARTIKRSAYIFATGFMAFAIAGEIISAAVSGGADKDKKESYLKYLIRKGIGGMVGVGTSFIPTAGPIANSAYEALTSPKGRPADFSIELSPVTSGLASGVHGLGAVSNLVTKKKALTGHNIQDLFTMLGVTSGLPLAPASKPISYMTDLKQNRVEKPNNPLELVRGLVTGKATPKK